MWRNVSFFDESDKGIVRERYTKCNIAEGFHTGKSRSNSACKTELQIFRRPYVNTNGNRTSILEEYVLPFPPFIGKDVLFMQDPNPNPPVVI